MLSSQSPRRKVKVAVEKPHIHTGLRMWCPMHMRWETSKYFPVEMLGMKTIFLYRPNLRQFQTKMAIAQLVGQAKALNDATRSH
jgi:hypothetical protein